jgi:hypothetical protein
MTISSSSSQRPVVAEVLDLVERLTEALLDDEELAEGSVHAWPVLDADLRRACRILRSIAEPSDAMLRQVADAMRDEWRSSWDGHARAAISAIAKGSTDV